MVYPDCPCTDSDSKTDRKEKKQEERRRGRSMRTTRLTKIAMVIFLSMIFFLGVQRPVLAADRNTTVKIPVEQIFEVNNLQMLTKQALMF